MSQFESVKLLPDCKRQFATEIFKRLIAINGIISVTLVGSFCDGEGIAGISDIDVVVICKSLNRDLFNQCSSEMSSISPELLGLDHYRVYLNTTLGPLKYTEENQIVIHLMIYDVESHRTHVLKSPFTCLDWQRSRVFVGKRLQEIYPVILIQPSDFINARRSVSSYTDDLRMGVISYRYYDFIQSKVVEHIGRAELDNRLRGEYAFHIVKNLVQNYAKLIRKTNALLKEEDLVKFWSDHLPKCVTMINEYKNLQRAKLANNKIFADNILSFANNFISLFQAQIDQDWGNTRQIIFCRHAITELNDGKFLGQGRNPSIVKAPEYLPKRFSKVFVSPMRRAVETATALQPNATFVVDDRLAEINYGQIEGLDVGQVSQRFPELGTAWREGKDLRFPDGENLGDVRTRLFAFLDSIREHSGLSILVVTHNVVLRCLLGELLGLNMKDWHRIKIDHLELFEVLIQNGEFYLNLNEAQKTRISDSISAQKET